MTLTEAIAASGAVAIRESNFYIAVVTISIEEAEEWGIAFTGSADFFCPQKSFTNPVSKAKHVKGHFFVFAKK